MKGARAAPMPLKPRQKIATLLFALLAVTSALVLLGLLLMTLRLVQVHAELADLRDTSLPRLVKLSQLSQESSASIAIAPSLSTNPTRFEFETLLSRIKDKEGSQDTLIRDLRGLIRDPDAARVLKKNHDLLVENLRTLTTVVRHHIGVRKRLEKHIDTLRGMARQLSRESGHRDYASAYVQLSNTTIYKILNALADPNQARFSRNKREIAAGITELDLLLVDAALLPEAAGGPQEIVVGFQRYWSSRQDRIYEDKTAQLTNAFKIKALVEENSLIANRLLSSANSEFWRASNELTVQTERVATTTRLTLGAMVVVVLAFAVGGFLLLFILQRRVFRRLDHIRDALRAFAEDRKRPSADPRRDEIGEISTAMMDYMALIELRESDLAQNTAALEQLSNKLAKYLSPQVYDSIFTGKQEVKLTSSRKKLTVFFSDIAEFTQTADRLESEELTQLLNQYLTEMSRIALWHGATIDKYVGDAIMIFFGDPDTNGTEADALACVRMAIAMRDRLRELETVWRASGIETPLTCRMGIHTGYCTVGNFGSEDRLDYTIIGGAVNTASRLESLAEPGQILISHETFSLVREEIRCEEHGEIEVRGIAYPVATYRVVDTQENADKHWRRFREEHPTLRIDMDIDAMTNIERERAIDTLNRALNHLAEDRPGPESDED